MIASTVHTTFASAPSSCSGSGIAVAHTVLVCASSGPGCVRNRVPLGGQHLHGGSHTGKGKQAGLDSAATRHQPPVLQSDAPLQAAASNQPGKANFTPQQLTSLQFQLALPPTAPPHWRLCCLAGRGDADDPTSGAVAARTAACAARASACCWAALRARHSSSSRCFVSFIAARSPPTHPDAFSTT